MTKKHKETFHCIPNDQGTGTYETCLCSECFEKPENIAYARDRASNTDDIDPFGKFEDCSQNDALECCICGMLCGVQTLE